MLVGKFGNVKLLSALDSTDQKRCNQIHILLSGRNRVVMFY